MTRLNPINLQDDQVSCQVLGTIISVCEQKEIDLDWVLETVPFDEAHLAKRTNFIDWASFVEIINRITSRLTEQEVLELAEASYQYPVYKVWKLIGQLRYDLFGFYVYIIGEGGAADRLYPLKVENLVMNPALRRLSVRFSIPEHLEPCETLLKVFEGQAIGMSRFMGYGPAQVKAVYGPRQVEFDILLPRETGLIPKLRRILTYPFTWRSSIRALEETQNALIQLQNELAEESRQTRAEKDRAKLIEDQLDLVLGHQPVMLWTLDMELNSTYMSASVERFIGYTVAEMKELPPFATIAQESQQVALETFTEFLEREKSGDPFFGTSALRFLQIRKDGSTFWSENYLSFLRDDKQKPIGIMGFSVDVTDVIAREAREESLVQQVQSLRQREFVSQLAGGIAHDFNNSLQSITGFAELALAKMEALNDTRFGEFVQLQEHILHSAAGAADLTKKLLALSRQQTLSRQTLDVNNWLNDCLPMARSVLGKNIELSTEFNGSGHAYIDALQMERALLNLLINARDAMTHGGQIKIRTSIHDSTELQFLFSEDKPQVTNQYFEIRVEDNGCGIPEQDLERIFEPFFSSKGAELGSGLGLAVTAGIVDQHEGFIRAANVDSGGAVLSLYLPYTESRAAPLSGDHKAFSYQGLRILLVDDEEMVRELCRSFLETDGAIVAEAGSGQMALDRVQSERFDLIVMDVVMPEMSGNEAAKFIREIYPDQRFLFATGFAGSQAVLADLAQDKVLPKPFRRADLLAAISEVMSDTVSSA